MLTSPTIAMSSASIRSEHNCEFCREFAGKPDTRFYDIYRRRSRVVAQTPRFAALPTLGQLVDRSLLVLPWDHVETVASMALDHQRELMIFVRHLTLQMFGSHEVIIFEHGATCQSGGSCGIYHAHLHLTPIPSPLDPGEFFPEATDAAPSLMDAWQALRASSHYLIFSSRKGVRYRDVATSGGLFPSQFFRRRLVEQFRLSRPWDWRSFRAQEPAILDILARWRCSDVSQSQSAP
jgi:hypothetical protein